MTDLDRLDRRYGTILCDIWGVVHDGGRLLPGAQYRLRQFRDEGRKVILLTNAPRPAETIEHQLDRMGLVRDDYFAITSSGEAGIAALIAPRRPVGFMGTAEDRADLERHGVQIVDGGFGEVACTGLPEPRTDPAHYRLSLERWASDGVVLHCLNPDRIVMHLGQREACAGALADIYESLGGKVSWYGKPYRPIYDHARSLAGDPPAHQMVAIGDGLQTDILGAATYGIDAVYVSHGVHEGEPVPNDFAARHGLGDWRPIMTVTGLA